MLKRLLPGSLTLRYLLIGGYNSVFGYGSFLILWVLLRGRMSYMLVLIICQLLGLANGYVTQRVLVFRAEGSVVRQGARFSLVYGAVFAANLILLPTLVRGLHLGVVVAQTIAIGVIMPSTYFAHRWYTFRHPSRPRLEHAEAAAAGSRAAAPTGQGPE